MSFQHNGRGSDAKGIHFYQTIQLRHLQDQELMIPRNFVDRYWKDVSNPISLKFPNGSDCKMYWVQQGDDILLQNWKKIARSLRCGDLLVFQYKGGSNFHVIIFDDSKLEIDYSSIRYNDDQEEEEHENPEQPLKKRKINPNDSVATPQGTNIDDQEEEHENIEQFIKRKKINSNDSVATPQGTNIDDQEEEEHENTEQFIKKKKINSNDSVATPQGTNIDKRKVNMNATQQKISEANSYRGGMVKNVKKCTKNKDGNQRNGKYCNPNENPSFTLTLPRSYVEGRRIRLRIPTQFSKDYMNDLLQMNAMIRSVGEDRTWSVKLLFLEAKRYFVMSTGWKSFSQEHNLQVGDECKFEMTQREPLTFTITITRSTKEPIPKQFQENQRVHEKSETTPVKNMEFVGNLEEGILRICSKTHGLKNSETPNLQNKFKISVTSLFMLMIPSEFLKGHNISNGNSVELKVGEGTWFVEVSFKQNLNYGWFTKGWPEFVKECKVKIGDTCLFESIDFQNHVFKVSIILDV